MGVESQWQGWSTGDNHTKSLETSVPGALSVMIGPISASCVSPTLSFDGL
jgi:hypothetical protein